jgi:hypothetical protein
MIDRWLCTIQYSMVIIPLAELHEMRCIATVKIFLHFAEGSYRELLALPSGGSCLNSTRTAGALGQTRTLAG